ncbi:enoyl-(Acyl carrier protein) reductase domain-containing protein [Sarocladium implicatum]|nr:enoyl-(Acyl carrier protein) reductase domain-containing protein [Sarocladium implicatum]
MANKAQAPAQAAATTSSSSSPSQLPEIKRIAPPSNSPRLTSKVAIITGANSPLGIGRATAHLYAESDALALYICDYDGTHLDEHKRDIESKYPGVEVHTRRFDAADEGAVKKVVGEAMERYGRLDVFFANAGIGGPMSAFTDTSDKEFMEVLRINTLSVFLAAKHAVPAMRKTSPSKTASSGSFIATASVAGIRSNAGSSAYSASKAAVISLTQTLAYQTVNCAVRINAICPGIIETGMTAPLYEAARARGTEKRVGQLNPLKRGAHADEVARVALFLASDESSYVNGQSWAAP